MFSAFQTFGRLGAGARAVAAAWTPLALWPTGTEPGMWIDPSNLASQWQDSIGTTPVATPGSVADGSNPVGLALDLRLGATALTDPGNHLLQATSTARPLLSAYDGQTLGPGNTYDATGFPVYQHFDGTDDGMATATFAAGTLSNAMDCMIAVRRDSGAQAILGLYNGTLPDQGAPDFTRFFGVAESASSAASFSECGTPTVWVDNVQLSGGTAVTRGTLASGLTVGEWHILELRNLDLSAWTAARFGAYYTYQFNGPRGDIMLYPSAASTEDKDAARQYLADKYGVTLP